MNYCPLHVFLVESHQPFWMHLKTMVCLLCKLIRYIQLNVKDSFALQNPWTLKFPGNEQHVDQLLCQLTGVWCPCYPKRMLLQAGMTLGQRSPQLMMGMLWTQKHWRGPCQKLEQKKLVSVSSLQPSSQLVPERGRGVAVGFLIPSLVQEPAQDCLHHDHQILALCNISGRKVKVFSLSGSPCEM
ncbi:uncharacterized protein M6G45_006240 [Spheniscus humboldti]